MSEMDALYNRARAVLWVEDGETRAWLDAVWQGSAPTIQVLVGGGQENVRAMCSQAVDAGFTHVFGLVDQDFGNTNRDRWELFAPVERVYRLDVHETENLMIDADALAGCGLNTGHRERDDIEDKLLLAAQNRSWWVACVRFLVETRAAATTGYPRDPKSITSLAEARMYINQSDWFRSTAAACPGLADPATVTAKLVQFHTAADQDLATNTWRRSFPGKEIFREVSGHVYQNGAGRAGRLDLIKAVGAWQRRAEQIPPQAMELRQCIIDRIRQPA